VVCVPAACDVPELVQSRWLPGTCLLDPRPDGWHDLIDRIRASPASPLTAALNSPLALTLIRDTYRSADDARELVNYCDTIQQRASGTQAAEERGRQECSLVAHLWFAVASSGRGPAAGVSAAALPMVRRLQAAISLRQCLRR
jgi:hypothetical protein